MNTMNFLPNPGATVNIAVGAASANVQVTVPGGGCDLRITNSGSQVVFVKFGTDNTVAAVATTEFPILANTVEMFNATGPVVFVAAIAGATGSTLYITPGLGQ